MSRKRWRSSPPVKPRGDEAKGASAPRTRGTATRVFLGSRNPIQDRKNLKAGNDRNACWLTDGAGQGAFTEELSVDGTRMCESRGLHAIQHSVGDFAWHLYTRPSSVAGWRKKRLHGATSEAGAECAQGAIQPTTLCGERSTSSVEFDLRSGP